MLHLGSIGRTTIKVDFNFLFLVLFFVVLNYDAKRGVQYALIWIPVIFISVLFHEFAHAGGVGIFRLGPSQIVLTGMGGVTFYDRHGKPWQELLISLAGPMANFGLAAISYWILRNVEVARTDRMLVVLMPLLVFMNAFWGVFNLVPVSPLDGGHATREFFRMFLSERTAFVVSIWIAMIVGGAVIAYAVWARQFFIAIYLAMYVYLAFQQWQSFKRGGVPGD